MKIMTETVIGQPVSHRGAPRATAIALALACLATALTGCVYRMPIQQGNFLDPTMVSQVKAGMTRSQVRYILGTPMVAWSFDNSRWDYGYYLKMKRLQTPRRAHVTVYFADNVVARVDSDVKDSVIAPINARPVAASEPRDR